MKTYIIIRFYLKLGVQRIRGNSCGGKKSAQDLSLNIQRNLKIEDHFILKLNKKLII